MSSDDKGDERVGLPRSQCQHQSTKAQPQQDPHLFSLLACSRPSASCSHGSSTSEDLFWKLDALQMFVLDLHWPEPEFAKHLEQRLKLMASDMIEACVKR